MTGRTFRTVLGAVSATVSGVLAALAAGIGAAVASASLTPAPSAFLTAGLAAAGLAGAAVAWFSLRRRPAPRRHQGAVISAFAAVALAAVALLLPLRDPRPPAAAPGETFWSLPTGSRIAYTRLPAATPAPRTAGPQPPVVVLHGGPGIPDRAGDVAFFAPLAGLGRDVYVYDQLGSGHSSRLADPRGYTIDRDVADLEEVRLRIGADRLALVGFSYGGALAARYLAAHPDRVERMVLLSPGPLDPADTSGDRASAGLGTRDRLRTYALTFQPRPLLGWLLTQVDPSAAHAYLGDAEADARNDLVLTAAEPGLHCPPTATPLPVHGSGFYAWQYPQSPTAPPARDVRPALHGLPTPVLVVKGSCDYLTWRSAVTYRRALANTTVVHLTDAGHAVHRDRPRDVLALTTAFLAGGPLPLPPYLPDVSPPGYRGPA